MHSYTWKPTKSLMPREGQPWKVIDVPTPRTVWTVKATSAEKPPKSGLSRTVPSASRFHCCPLRPQADMVNTLTTHTLVQSLI